MNGLPSFPATDKRKDPRYKWFVRNYGKRCWELDAMDPNDLRACVETGDQETDRARGVETLRDRQPGGAGESLQTILEGWGAQRAQEIDLIGKSFGRLVVTAYAGNRDWFCAC